MLMMYPPSPLFIHMKMMKKSDYRSIMKSQNEQLEKKHLELKVTWDK